MVMQVKNCFSNGTPTSSRVARGGGGGATAPPPPPPPHWHVEQNAEWENTSFLALLRLFYALEWPK